LHKDGIRLLVHALMLPDGTFPRAVLSHQIVYLPGGASPTAPVGTLLQLRPPLRRLPQCVIRIPRHADLRRNWRRLALDGAPVHGRDTAEQTPL